MLTPIRLLKPYRSSHEGDVIEVTYGLARRLIAAGVACEDLRGRQARPMAAVERAVAPYQAEVR